MIPIIYFIKGETTKTIKRSEVWEKGGGLNMKLLLKYITSEIILQDTVIWESIHHAFGKIHKTFEGQRMNYKEYKLKKKSSRDSEDP